MEHFQIVQLFAHARKLDGFACHGTHAECGTATGIAVQFGENNTVQAGALAEALGHIDRVLTGHGVDDQQCLIHWYRLFDAA